MGGLVSRLQTIESGDEFWRILSDQNFQDVKGKPDDVEKLKNVLFFEPNTSIRRVVTIGTPHRGSDYSNDYTQWLARKVIKLPTTITDTGYSLARQNPNLFRDTDLLTTNTSIDSLSPNSPIFRSCCEPDGHLGFVTTTSSASSPTRASSTACPAVLTVSSVSKVPTWMTSIARLWSNRSIKRSIGHREPSWKYGAFCENILRWFETKCVGPIATTNISSKRRIVGGRG